MSFTPYAETARNQRGCVKVIATSEWCSRRPTIRTSIDLSSIKPTGRPCTALVLPVWAWASCGILSRPCHILRPSRRWGWTARFRQTLGRYSYPMMAPTRRPSLHCRPMDSVLCLGPRDRTVYRPEPSRMFLCSTHKIRRLRRPTRQCPATNRRLVTGRRPLCNPRPGLRGQTTLGPESKAVRQERMVPSPASARA
jgi:hypothetical protein